MTESLLKVSDGYLRGLEKKTVLNAKKYYSFQGIPYAKPPTGQNRFKDPVPCSPWEGVKDATRPGNVCPQLHRFDKKFIGNEDCLFLNVYTPQIPDEKICGTLKLPVMVFFHGGSFLFGSGNDDLYGPDYIVEHGVILVTINYRFGVFGFLSLGNSDVPGNAGLKDQSLALRWVHDNIKYFSGDCGNITIFGSSGGAGTVHYHTLSTHSKGLFHKVILQSGSVLSPWALCINPIQRAITLCQVLGHRTNDVNEISKILRAQSPDILVANQTKILGPEDMKSLTFPFVPCIEVEGTGENFLTESPESLLQSKQFAQVPYIIGCNNNEGMFSLKAVPDLLLNVDQLNYDPKLIIPPDLWGNGTCPDDVAKKVKKFFCNDVPFSLDNISHYCDIFGDIQFTIGIDRTIRYLSLQPNIPIYLYSFSFEGRFGYSKGNINVNLKGIPKGVCHGDELGYMFFNNSINKGKFPIDIDAPEVDIVNKVCTLWTNFAKTSDPNEKRYAVKWKCYDTRGPSHLVIDKTLKVVNTDILSERAKFWRNIYASVHHQY